MRNIAMVAEDRDLSVERRQRRPRLKTMFPVNVTIVDPTDGVLAWGKATLSDISEAGLRLSMIRFTWGHLPMEPHYQMVVVPAEAELRDLWIKARPVHVRFSAYGAYLGAEIVKAAEGIERLFELVPARN